MNVAIKRIDEWMIRSQTKEKKRKEVRNVLNDNNCACVFTEKCQEFEARAYHPTFSDFIFYHPNRGVAFVIVCVRYLHISDRDGY